jgi:HD-GYP domain-containing protein (c-di-GMP phosphodiesterase class II)
MLKKIPVSDLRVGMHLHALDGAWLEHPFWRTKFVIADSAVIRQLAESPVRECWIDTALGLDVASPPDPADAPVPATQARMATVLAPVVSEAPVAPAPTRSQRDELVRAAAVCNRGRAAMMSMFREARMGQALDAEACGPLVDEITASVTANPGALISLARLKTKDDYSYMHSLAVCALMIALGRQLGMDTAACRAAGLAGLLHDIGKAVMPLDVLNKPGRLTDAEFAVIRTHPERGHDLLVEGRGTSDEARLVCLLHHERMDGTGYPKRLKGDDVPLLARMGAVCDVYDAITSNRPYKSGWDPAESIARMASWKGHFDPEVFSAFVRSLGIYPTGSLVRLESGKLAVVVEQNADALVRPVVRAFFSTKSKMPIAPLLIDLSRQHCADRIVARESPAEWGFSYLNDLWLPPELQKQGS